MRKSCISLVVLQLYVAAASGYTTENQEVPWLPFKGGILNSSGFKKIQVSLKGFSTDNTTTTTTKRTYQLRPVCDMILGSLYHVLGPYIFLIHSL